MNHTKLKKCHEISRYHEMLLKTSTFLHFFRHDVAFKGKRELQNLFQTVEKFRSTDTKF